MKNIFLLSSIFAASTLGAQTYRNDKVYTANQISNTVSVIDPATNLSLGEIILGKPQPEVFSALYKGESLVHGLGYSPQNKLLAVVSVGSNSVSFISTETDSLLKTLYLGRSPHEPSFTPDGKQVWITIRGESYVSVVDTYTMTEIKRIEVPNGPGMVAFSPDGALAFVCSSFTPELTVIDAENYLIKKSIPVVSPFSPNISCSPNGQWVALTHKDVGKLTIINTKTMGVERIIPVGKITNHVTFRGDGSYEMLVTAGGENKLLVYDIRKNFSLTSTINLGDLPHGLSTGPDGKYAYVGLENEDKLAVVDLDKKKVLHSIAVGQAPQAVVYAVNATTSKTDRLSKPASHRTQVINLKAVEGVASSGLIVARNIGLTDLLQLQFTKLESNEIYQLILTNSPETPFKNAQVLTKFETNATGTYNGQCTGIINTTNPADAAIFNYMVLVKLSGNKVVMISGK